MKLISEKTPKILKIMTLKNKNLEIVTNNNGNIETIGTIIQDNNKYIATISDNSILETVDIIVKNGIRFKKVPKPKTRLTEPLLKLPSEKAVSKEEEDIDYSQLLSELENDVAASQERSGKIKKLERPYQTRQ